MNEILLETVRSVVNAMFSVVVAYFLLRERIVRLEIKQSIADKRGEQHDRLFRAIVAMRKDIQYLKQHINSKNA